MIKEIEKYKEMSLEEIDEKDIPRLDDKENNENITPLSIYVTKVGKIVVKCSYAKNGKTLEDCFMSYLKKKALLMDR